VLYQNEIQLLNKSQIIAGTDEAGRGPLAGPVVAAAVILDHSEHIIGLNDSKKLSEMKRERLYIEIINNAVSWKVSIVSSQTIDEINILQASLKAMQNAVLSLDVKPDICLVDGNKLPVEISHFSRAIVKGDSTYASIAAASILAKVTRDRIMLKLHKEHPEYNFARNKGYPTKEHLLAINRYGILDCHRRSYKPIQQLGLVF
jgi:ribonuclease HII